MRAPLVIRQVQLDALRADAIHAADIALLQRLAARFPGESGFADFTSARIRLDEMRRAMAVHGITTRRDLERLLNLIGWFGDDVFERPKTGWMRAILADTKTRPHDRIDRLIAAVERRLRARAMRRRRGARR